MSIHTLHLTANTTAELVGLTLKRAYPEVDFDIEVAIPSHPNDLAQCLAALVIRWNRGPEREQVEGIVEPFQSLVWNPVSGVLEIVEHMEVTEEGALQQVQYGVDYVLCEGPPIQT